MNVSLIVPLGDGHNDTREAHWEWLRARWEALRPAWEVVEGRCRADRWCKAEAVHNATTNATGDVWVICDADLWVESWPTLRDAALYASEHGWCVPCGNVYRLNATATNDIVAHDPDDQTITWPTNRTAMARNPYRLFPGGGIFAITPDAYRTAGGFDPRFVGWGGEDLAFAAALRTIVGEPARLEASVWHLHHRPASKVGRMSNTNDRLCRRYLHAEGDTVAMSRLIEEAHQWQTQQ